MLILARMPLHPGRWCATPRAAPARRCGLPGQAPLPPGPCVPPRAPPQPASAACSQAARGAARLLGLDRRCCWGGADFKGDSTRISKGILHAQRGERHLRGAHVANEPTHNGVGLGNPSERCLASTGRGKRRRVGRALQMAENLADHLDLGDGGDNAQCSLTGSG